MKLYSLHMVEIKKEKEIHRHVCINIIYISELDTKRMPFKLRSEQRTMGDMGLPRFSTKCRVK